MAELDKLIRIVQSVSDFVSESGDDPREIEIVLPAATWRRIVREADERLIHDPKKPPDESPPAGTFRLLGVLIRRRPDPI